ncbi:MAG: type I secretion system permease/ATPase [Hydrogenophaga sp.]|uniref:type I secretion system permease/ATPase n=1 Tax=Hydrogenophaga sp. TaxID=1904254 RepID=UPI003D0E5734
MLEELPGAVTRESDGKAKGLAVVQTTVTLARLHGVYVTPAMLLDEAGVAQDNFAFLHAVQALKGLGFKCSWAQADATHLSNAFCPLVLEMAPDEEGASRSLIATAIRDDFVTVIDPTTQAESDLRLAEIGTVARILLVAPPPLKARSVDWIDRIQGADWFWGSLLRHRRTLLEAVMLTAVINVLAIGMSVFTMSVYDRVLPNSAFTTLWALALGVSIAMVFEFAARTVRTHALDRVGKKMDLTLGSIVFRQVLMLRLEKQQGSSSGSMAQVIREYESVRDFVTSLSLTVLADLPFMLFFFAVISYIGGPLAYVPIAGAVVLMVTLIAMQYPLQRLMSEQMRQGAARSGLVVESIAALDSLKSLRAEALIVRQHDRLAAESAQIGLRTRMITSFSTHFYGLIQQVCTVALLAWGVYLVSEGKATSGVLIASVILMGRAMQPLGMVASLASRFQGARTALTALNKIMESPREREPGLSYFHRSHWEGRLELRDVSFKYSNELPDVVQKCTLEIKPGERVGVIGRMGGGKSTLLRLMAGLYQTTGGEVMMDGQDLRHVDVSDVRRCIRMLTQDVRLMRGTLMENLRLAAPHAGDDVLMQAAQDAGVADFARTHPLGLNMPVGEGGQMLSGGQRQAVALAQVLLADARLLLLDEPTASMDQYSENAIYKAFEQASKGRTLVLVTHKGSLLGLVDRLVVMDQGRIVMDGPRDEVLKRLAGAAAQMPAHPAPVVRKPVAEAAP